MALSVAHPGFSQGGGEEGRVESFIYTDIQIYTENSRTQEVASMVRKLKINLMKLWYSVSF